MFDSYANITAQVQETIARIKLTHTYSRYICRCKLAYRDII